VIALGKPKGKIVPYSIKPDGDTRHWRDESGVHDVPKYSVDEIIVSSGYSPVSSPFRGEETG
jgi:hypothetical protein